MKKFTLLITLLSFTLLSYLQAQVNVTINVDMSDVADFDPATRQLDFAGAFDDWSAFFPMSNLEGDIYTVTFSDVGPGYYGGDAYHNDKGSPGWGAYGEWSGAPTGIDILVYVGTEDVTVNTKWGKTYSITCSVDMNAVEEFDAATDSVYFISEEVGPLNEKAMTDADADGIYTVTFEGVPSGHFPTVFAYGPSTADLTYEWEYASNKGLRVLILGDLDIEESFTFGEADGEILKGVDVTINLDMRSTDFDDGTEVIHLSGELNGWTSPGDDPLYKFAKSGLGTYTLTLTGVAPGYYLNDFYRDVKGSESWGANGEWSGGPTGIDVMILVGEENVIFDSEWGKVFNMTFRVDMNEVSGFDAATDTVYLINEGVGALNHAIMNDEDEDGIYMVAFDSIPQGNYPAIFAYGSTAGELTSEWPWIESATRVLNINEADIDRIYKFGAAEGIDTGIRGNTAKNQSNLSFYPNPVTNGLIHVKTDGFAENSTIRLFNVQGQEVYLGTIQKQSTHIIDVNHLDKGFYILSISDGATSSNAKIIFE